MYTYYFIQNISKTFFTDYRHLGYNSITSTTIFVNQLTNFFNVCFRLWHTGSAKARVVFGYSSSLSQTLNPIKHMNATKYSLPEHYHHNIISCGSYTEQSYKTFQVNDCCIWIFIVFWQVIGASVTLSKCYINIKGQVTLVLKQGAIPINSIKKSSTTSLLMFASVIVTPIIKTWKATWSTGVPPHFLFLFVQKIYFFGAPT